MHPYHKFQILVYNLRKFKNKFKVCVEMNSIKINKKSTVLKPIVKLEKLILKMRLKILVKLVKIILKMR